LDFLVAAEVAGADAAESAAEEVGSKELVDEGVLLGGGVGVASGVVPDDVRGVLLVVGVDDGSTDVEFATGRDRVIDADAELGSTGTEGDKGTSGGVVVAWETRKRSRKSGSDRMGCEISSECTASGSVPESKNRTRYCGRAACVAWYIFGLPPSTLYTDVGAIDLAVLPETVPYTLMLVPRKVTFAAEPATAVQLVVELNSNLDPA
jgi:hypothetical protein